MARVWACVCVWACAVVCASGAGRRHNNEVAEGPRGVLVETLRQVLQVPQVGGSGRHPHPRPPRYMMTLYNQLTDGRGTLPRRSNTVRSYLPSPGDGEGGVAPGGLLVYNVSASAKEHVLGAWLHVKGGRGRARLPSRPPRPLRVLLYLLNAPHWQPSTPIITVNVKAGKQEVEVTRAVRESLGHGSGGPSVLMGVGGAVGGRHLVGVRLEELRRGRFVSRPISKLVKHPPLLLVYSSDPALLDLAAKGVPELNATVAQVMADQHQHQHHALGPKDYHSSRYYKRYTRDIQPHNRVARLRRALEDDYEEEYEEEEEDRRMNLWEEEDEEEEGQEIPWLEQEIIFDDIDDEEGDLWDEMMEEEEEEEEEEEGEEDNVIPHSHAHAIMTNELPLAHNHDNNLLTIPEQKSPRKTKTSSHEPKKRKNRRRRRKQKQQRRDNLIPLPDNYSRARWGDNKDGGKDKARRKSKRTRRRKNQLPDQWMMVAQNYISNDANSLKAVLGGGAPRGSSRPCERHHLEIDFKELGWDQWIVAPKTFDAFYCAGVCPAPLTKNLSGSNHAIIQSLIYAIGKRPEVPGPCCVPNSMEALSILFMEPDERFVLKNYPKMSVASCSCQ